MTPLRTNYSLTLDTLVNLFDQGIQLGIDLVGARVLGNRLDTITEEVQKLPRHVQLVNLPVIEESLKAIINELDSSYMIQGNDQLKNELDAIENLINRQMVYPFTRINRTVGRVAANLWNKAWSVAFPSPLQPQTEIVDNARDAVNRFKRLWTSFTPHQKYSLSHQPKTEETYILHLAKFEVITTIFNLATVSIASTVTLGFFGLIGLKTTMIVASSWYLLRVIADRASQYESWVKLPVVVPIPVPFLGGLYFLPWRAVSIPTFKGLEQTCWKVINYGFRFTLTRALTEKDKEPLDRNMSLKTAEGRAVIWKNMKRIHPFQHDDWKPNFLVINDVVILKNQLFPFHVAAAQGIKAYYNPTPPPQQRRDLL